MTVHRLRRGGEHSDELLRDMSGQGHVYLNAIFQYRVLLIDASQLDPLANRMKARRITQIIKSGVGEIKSMLATESAYMQNQVAKAERHELGLLNQVL